MKTLHYIFFLISIHKVQLYLIKNQNKPTCANCKFFIPNKNKCSNFGDIKVITGKYTYEPAISVRNDEDKCGENALFFKKNNLKFITIPYYFLLENGKSIFLLSYGFFLLFSGIFFLLNINFMGV